MANGVKKPTKKMTPVVIWIWYKYGTTTDIPTIICAHIIVIHSKNTRQTSIDKTLMNYKST